MLLSEATTISIFNWNYRSKDLSLDEIRELKAYYYANQRKCWAHKKAFKHYRNFKLMGNSLSVLFASGVRSN